MARGWTAAILAVGLLSGCASSRAVSTAPMASFRPAWGDERADRIREWNAWADANLRNGDIVFMRGDCYVLMGAVNFSELTTDLTDSRFSHVGLISIENDQAYVYDIRNVGCLRTRFGDLLAHRQLHQVAIKRHREASPEARASAATFCRNVFERREKFDDDLKLGNGRLYCAELIEQAYQSAGYSLSQAVAIQDLPNYDKHLKTIQFVRSVTSIEPDQPVLLPGNEQFGIWANPDLDLILDLPDTKVRPSMMSGRD